LRRKKALVPESSYAKLRVGVVFRFLSRFRIFA
jgi:hypothetical protein